MATNKVQFTRRELGEILASDAAAEERKKAKLKVPINSDTKIRIDIHSDIKRMLAEGRKRIDILVQLSNKYPDTYLSKFFEQWIEHHIVKKDYLQVLDKESR